MLPISLKNNLTAGLSIINEADQKILIITKPHLGLNLKKLDGLEEKDMRNGNRFRQAGLD